MVKRIKQVRPAAVCRVCTKYLQASQQFFDDEGRILCEECYNDWYAAAFCEECGYKWSECRCKKELYG